jgi:GT2 family glycosyltransferase
MSTNVRIAIVVPCRDERATIVACLRSARLQEPAPACVVVVDNGSTDGSVAEARTLADLVVEDESTTIGRLRNVGVAAAGRSDVVAFLDADCVAEPGWLAAALRGLQSADVVGARTAAPTQSSWVARRWAAVEERLAGAAAYVGSANMVLRRACFDRVRGFDESLRTSEDVDLCERITAAGGRVAVVPDMRVVHHGAPQSVFSFAARQLWHASTPGWWWKASRRARLLVAVTVVWGLAGVGTVLVGLLLRAWWLPVVWAVATVVGIVLLGAAVGARRHAAADGALLALWALTHAARVRTGRAATRGA